MVLHRRYGDPGVRVVRYGSGAEYGHQRYYDRLGHIHVYTPDSGIVDAERVQVTRSDFFDQAAAVIESGKNLVICPEGSSGPTSSSPGPFKAGAFALAAKLRPEPFIVPIAVANFDGRLGDAPFAVAISAPFRVSERIDEKQADAMADFLRDLRGEFRDRLRQIQNGCAGAATLRTSIDSGL
ncbi:MAG: 1-acyl-sn-glycerol-3-phosphate acyltransferase [Planctomycetota bacterium]|nr:1-acyl-sn-glycerol-3-phosphate acyltransferase [Planctomycetota bacterium]